MAMKIDTKNCEGGVDADYLLDLIKANKKVEGTVYVYDNDMVDEGCEPYSATRFKPGDRVCLRKADGEFDFSKEYVVEKVVPATYGFMNVFVEGAGGKRQCSYSGDVEFAAARTVMYRAVDKDGDAFPRKPGDDEAFESENPYSVALRVAYYWNRQYAKLQEQKADGSWADAPSAAQRKFQEDLSAEFTFQENK